MLVAAAIFIGCGAFLSGCGANVDPLIITPNRTPTATLTPPPTYAFNPSPTPRTPTPAYTLTEGPTPTSVFGPTATSLLGATPEYGPLTPTITPVLGEIPPQVDYFVADAENVIPGESVTLAWSAQGAEEATIYRLGKLNRREQYWTVPLQGMLTVSTNPDDRDAVNFLLSVGEGTRRVEVSLSLPVQCSELWFFQPAPEICPKAPPTLTTQAEASFERGRMIWVDVERRIYVLYTDGEQPAWESFPDRFIDGETPDSDPNIIPPAGLFQPIRGFGLIWRTEPGIRDRLGWATLPEISYDGAIQRTATASDADDAATLYLRTQDRAIIALDPEGRGWRLIGSMEG